MGNCSSLFNKENQFNGCDNYIFTTSYRDLSSSVIHCQLRLKPSQLATTFLADKNLGLITEDFIPKNSIIPYHHSIMNDGMVDLTKLVSVINSREMYLACCDLYQNYYDKEKAAKIINIVIIKDNKRQFYYQAIKDIYVGDELIRMYGFTTWLFEILDIITWQTFGGYAKFVEELLPLIPKDPLINRVYSLNMICKMLIPNRDNLREYNGGVNLYSYDDNWKNLYDTERTVGDIIKLFMIKKLT